MASTCADTIAFEICSRDLCVRQALARLREALRARPLSAEDIGTVEVVLGEVLNNVVEHAYQCQSDGVIELNCAFQPHTLRFRVEDHGRAFPMHSLPNGHLPPLDGPLDTMPEGGFGWFLVRNLACDLAYQRQADKNVLAFTIPIETQL